MVGLSFGRSILQYWSEVKKKKTLNSFESILLEFNSFPMWFLVTWFKIMSAIKGFFYVLCKESLCKHACICQCCCDQCLHIAFRKCSGK